MAELVITNLEVDVLAKLERLAHVHGKDIEEMAGQILREYATGQVSASSPLGSRIAERFAKFGLTHAIPEFRGSSV